MRKTLLTMCLSLIAIWASAQTTLSITSEEIVSCKTGSVELASNAYGSQSTSNNSTWYCFAKGGINFTGAKVCTANGSNGVGIQMQGNASDATKQGFLGNTTALGSISKIVLKLNTISTSTYAPSFNVCVGTSELPTSTVTLPTAETGTKTVDSKEYKTYTYTIDLTGDNTYFAIRNDLAGALYIDEIDITYSGQASSLKPAGLSWSKSSITNVKGEEFKSPTFSKATTATVSFTTDDPDVATVDDNGVISLATDEGEATITASSPANDQYEAGTATCKIIVCHNNYYVKVNSIESGAKYLIVAQRNDSTFYAYPVSSSKAYGYWSVSKNKGLLDEISVKSTYDDEFIITSATNGYTIQDSSERYYYQSGTYNSFNLGTDASVWSCEPQSDGTFKFSMNDYIIQFLTSGTYTEFALYTTMQTGAVLPYLYKYNGTVSAINDITVAPSASDTTTYNLAGQRVSANTKGIIIKGGRKYINK